MKKRPGYYRDLLKEQINKDKLGKTPPQPSTSPAGPTFKPSTSPVNQPGKVSHIQKGPPTSAVRPINLDRSCCGDVETSVVTLNELIANYNSALAQVNSMQNVADAFGGDPNWFSNNFNVASISTSDTAVDVMGIISVAAIVGPVIFALGSPFAAGSILAAGTAGWGAITLVSAMVTAVGMASQAFNQSYFGSLVNQVNNQALEYKLENLQSAALELEQFTQQIENLGNECCQEKPQ